jgi:DNA-binding LytR/AlgR family response regulator
MSEAEKTPQKKEMSAADAAKLVRRTVTVTEADKDGEPVTKTKTVSVKADEVLAFRDYGSHVVVATTDGQKLSSLQGE